MPSNSPAKEPCFLRSERSPAFARFCERVHGKMLNQFGSADMDQLALLLTVLAPTPESHVLDAGCGTGVTTPNRKYLERFCRKNSSVLVRGNFGLRLPRESRAEVVGARFKQGTG